MQNVFSRATLDVCEDAAAGIPLRQIDRAFASAGVGLGVDPGGLEGARRTQFRRYVASIKQRDAKQMQRLLAAFSAMLNEVATSKVDFLVNAAERDGFAFVDGTFRLADERSRAKVLEDEVAQFLSTLTERGFSISEIASALQGSVRSGST